MCPVEVHTRKNEKNAPPPTTVNGWKSQEGPNTAEPTKSFEESYRDHVIFPLWGCIIYLALAKKMLMVGMNFRNGTIGSSSILLEKKTNAYHELLL
jgi:hypothetical protein